MDSHAQRLTDVLRVLHFGVDKTCEITVCHMDVRSADFARAQFLTQACRNRRRTIALVCLDDDSLCLSTALPSRAWLMTRKTIVVCRTQDWLPCLEASQMTAGASSTSAFALLDRACQPEQVLRGTREILSRAIHVEYLRYQRAAGDTLETNSSMKAWDDFPEDLREANRQQADDLRAKLGAMQCEIEPMPDWTEPLFAFTNEEVESGAEQEHVRWMDSKLRAGWRFGAAKDPSARTHPCLVPYADLPEREKVKDRETVRAIPKFLAIVGFRVYRRTNKPRTNGP